MTKTELVAKVKEVVASKLDTKVSNIKAGEIVEEIFGTIAESLVENGEVVLPGIGKLKIAEKAGRKGEVTRPDGTKIPYETAPGKRVKFVIGKSLKETLEK